MEKYWRWLTLTDIIKKNDLKVGYEIGVSAGLTYSQILARNPEIEWHGVDPWVDCPEYTTYPDGRRWTHEANYETVQKMAARYPGRAFTHREESVACAATVEDESIDIVFIDGLHTYEGVMDDITAWFPKVRKGGFIVGHDYKGMKIHEGVTIAVNECFGEENVNEAEDSVWWVQKED